MLGKRLIVVVALVIAGLTACQTQSNVNSGGGRTITSAAALKKYLDRQPANSPGNPIEVSVKANDRTIKGIAQTINAAGKYVSLDLSPSARLTAIGQEAFYECKTLASIIVPSGAASIGNWAFYNCASLTSITIPSSVTSIGNYAFVGCTRLANLTVPSSVTSIGSSVFHGCESLTRIAIPSSVMSIGNWVFGDWTSSQTITIQGHASQEAADSAWGADWRSSSNATIVYEGR